MNLPKCVLRYKNEKLDIKSTKVAIKKQAKQVFDPEDTQFEVMKIASGFPAQKVFAHQLNQQGIVAKYSVLWFGTMRLNRK